MYRVAFVLLGVLAVLHQSEAIKCYECTSLIDPTCNDKFSNHSLSILLDCSLRMPYDLTPIHYCRKIKYKQLGQSHVLRGCNVNDNLRLDEAKVHLCNTDACNSADNHRPVILFSLISTISLIFAYLRN